MVTARLSLPVLFVLTNAPALVLGCAGQSIDRIEHVSSASVTASTDTTLPTTATAKATLVRACMTAEPDPRTTSLHARACAASEPSGCRRLGVAHLCGANGSENGPAAIPLFEKSCQLEDEEGCLLLRASRVMWNQPGAVVSLLDESAR